MILIGQSSSEFAVATPKTIVTAMPLKLSNGHFMDYLIPTITYNILFLAVIYMYWLTTVLSHITYAEILKDNFHHLNFLASYSL